MSTPEFLHSFRIYQDLSQNDEEDSFILNKCKRNLIIQTFQKKKANIPLN